VVAVEEAFPQTKLMLEAERLQNLMKEVVEVD
jgi:hypothetical protein